MAQEFQGSRRNFMRVGGLGVTTAAAAGGLAMASLNAKEAAAQASSNSLLREVLDRGSVRVGTGSTNAPWHFVDGNGKLTGMDVAMGRVLGKALFDDESKVEFIRQEGAQRIPNVTANKIDVAIQFMTVNSKRAQLVAFSRPYFVEQQAILTKMGSETTTIDQLRSAGEKATISILQNQGAEAIVHMAVPGAQVLQLDTVANAIQAVESGRANGVCVSLSAARWHSKHNPDRFVDAGAYWFPQMFSAAVRQGDPDWLRYVSTAFSTAMYGPETSTYYPAIKEYFDIDPPPINPGFPTISI